MKTKVLVSLNDISLHDLAPEIILQSVQESAPNTAVNVTTNGNLRGQHINAVEHRYREVTVTYAIAEYRDMNRRRAIQDMVMGWAANGGKLKLNYRPGQYLQVMCATLPGMGYVYNWTKPIKIVFRAYQVPFWQASAADASTVYGTTSGTINVRGNTATPLTFRLTVTGETTSSIRVTDIGITVNGKSIAFRGLALSTGNWLQMDYDEHGMQRAYLHNGLKVLSYRDTVSEDDLWLQPGANTFSTSGAKCTWDVIAHGRWI